MMQLGAEGVFVGSGIFKSEDPERAAAAIVEATTHFDDPERVAAASRERSGAARWPGIEMLGARRVGACSSTAAGELASRVVGVLALQGDFEAHARMLRAARRRAARGAHARPTSTGSTGSCIPGGESTTMTLGIEREGSPSRCASSPRAGAPVLGTCAGLIMLDRDHLGLIDMLARRNAFGRQVHSFEADVEVHGLEGEPAAGGLHPRPLGRGARGGRRGAGRDRRPPGGGPRRATCSRWPSIPSSPTTPHPRLAGGADPRDPTERQRA